jgi:hypothetical protein
MKSDDFSRRVKAEALKRARFRCERCWSSQTLEFHHKVPVSQGGASDLGNCVVLCSTCHETAPEDPLLLKMFMEFASPKEMINYFRVDTEVEAIEAWCNKNGISTSETLRKLNIKSHRNSVIAAMRKKAMKGEICGFNAPLGYKFENGRLQIVEEEARIVKQIFNQYCSGRSLKEIAGSLNSNGIKTKKSNRWSIWAVRRILKNPIYAGYVKWKDIIKKGMHPLIIETKQFNKVQAKMHRKAIRKSSYRVYINDGGPSLSRKTEHQMEKSPVSTYKMRI